MPRSEMASATRTFGVITIKIQRSTSNVQRSITDPQRRYCFYLRRLREHIERRNRLEFESCQQIFEIARERGWVAGNINHGGRRKIDNRFPKRRAQSRRRW